MPIRDSYLSHASPLSHLFPQNYPAEQCTHPRKSTLSICIQKQWKWLIYQQTVHITTSATIHAKYLCTCSRKMYDKETYKTSKRQWNLATKLFFRGNDQYAIFLWFLFTAKISVSTSHLWWPHNALRYSSFCGCRNALNSHRGMSLLYIKGFSHH